MSKIQKLELVWIDKEVREKIEPRILIENYAGALPVWLSPVQAVVMSISEKHVD